MVEWISTGTQFRVSVNVWDRNKQLSVSAISLHLTVPVGVGTTRIRHGPRSGKFG